MPSSSWSRAISSTPSRIETPGSERRWSMSTGSRWSCGAITPEVGLIEAATSAVGKPIEISAPSVDARVRPTHPVGLASIAPERIALSSPQARMSSMVRRLTPVARGNGEGRAALDHQRADAVAGQGDRGGEPGGAGADDDDGGFFGGAHGADLPCCCSSCLISSDMMSFIRQYVFDRTSCQLKVG